MTDKRKKLAFKKELIIFVLMGSLYLTIECFWKFETQLPLFFCGGTIGMIIDLLNENNKFYNLKIYQQSSIGLLIIWIFEFITGYIFNIKLGMNLWDYSSFVYKGIPLHFKGQISIPYGFLFFILVPLVTWLGDELRFKLFNEKNRNYSICEIYKELIMGR